jgi:hypothetical protein
MAAQALRNDSGQQLGLYERMAWRPVAPVSHPRPSIAKPCAACRTKEARYGFREADRPNRPRTLCFECFRMEINRRQALAARLARGWNATQTDLPLAETLHELNLRRRRAQIAARRAIGL